jgi:propionyl-CoA synthetase
MGVPDAIKGEVPVGMIVLKANVERADDEIIAELVRMIRSQIGPVASFKVAAIVRRLPKTRSGKILRGTMRKIAAGEQFKVPATIDEPTILDEIADALGRLGYPN